MYSIFYYDREGMPFMTFVLDSLYPKGNNDPKDKGLWYLTFYVALFLIHSIWEQVSNRLRIKKIRSDNGTEFKNSQIEGFLEDESIKHEFSSPYTPQQNGVVERKNITLLDMSRTMLDEYKALDQFWAEAINTACYSINRLYLHRILKKTT
jgi:transposase InsO family protein